MRLFTLPLVLSVCLFNQYAIAQDTPDSTRLKLSVGAKYTLNYLPYKDQKVVQNAFPIVFFDSKRVYVEGDEAGIHLINNDRQVLNVTLDYDTDFESDHYRSGSAMRKLDKRRWSVLAGISYLYITPYGGFQTSFEHDVLSRSNGSIASASYVAKASYKRWTFYPELGLQWNDQKYNQYYFGVKPEESMRSGIKSYTAHQSINPYLSFAAEYALTPRLNVFANIDATYLSKAQQNSPMVDQRMSWAPTIGFRYQL